MGFSVGFFRCAESESPRLLVGALIARVVGTAALAFWLIAGVLPTPANAAAERRIALVIGNAQYPASKLKTQPTTPQRWRPHCANSALPSSIAKTLPKE